MMFHCELLSVYSSPKTILVSLLLLRLSSIPISEFRLPIVAAVVVIRRRKGRHVHEEAPHGLRKPASDRDLAQGSCIQVTPIGPTSVGQSRRPSFTTLKLRLTTYL